MEVKDKELHRIAITGIVWKRDGDSIKYLITKRAAHKKAWPNKWTVPGGGLNVDDYMHEDATYANSESPQWYNAVEKTLRREIKEEAGVEVGKPEYLLDLTFMHPSGFAALVLSYYAPYVSGEVAYDEDTSDHAWVTAEEAAQYDLIHGILDEIKMVEERLKHGIKSLHTPGTKHS